MLVAISIIGVLVAIALPAVQSAREAMRRGSCQNHLRQLALGLQNYHSAFRSLPPPVISTNQPGPVPICTSSNAFPGLNVWAEASSGDGHHGTSWLLQTLPFVERQNIFERWDFSTSVRGNREVAEFDIPLLYCPSRRSTVDNSAIMFRQWLSGGNDYGGCVGAVNGWHNCGSHEFWQTDAEDRPLSQARGVFFKMNHGTKFNAVLDGLSQTIMLAELQRLDGGEHVTTSRDGWAVGGASTHFSTCSDGCEGPNGDHFEAMGSNHIGGANIAFADGSVKFITESTSEELLKAMGGMTEGSVEQLEAD